MCDSWLWHMGGVPKMWDYQVTFAVSSRSSNLDDLGVRPFWKGISWLNVVFSRHISVSASEYKSGNMSDNMFLPGNMNTYVSEYLKTRSCVRVLLRIRVRSLVRRSVKFQNVHSRLWGLFLPKATLSRSKWLVDTWVAHSDVINARGYGSKTRYHYPEGRQQQTTCFGCRSDSEDGDYEDNVPSIRTWRSEWKDTWNLQALAQQSAAEPGQNTWDFCCTDGRGTKPHFQRANRKSTFFHPHDCLGWGGYVLEFICQVARSMFAGTQWIS